MGVVKDWSAAVIMLVAAGAFLELALPDGSMRRYVSFVFALMILDMLLAPLAAVGGALR